MATHNKDQASSPQKTENTTTKTIGAIVGIIALLGLLFFGVSQSKPAGAELITDAPTPEKAKYQEETSELNYEKAVLKEYDNGKLIEVEGKVIKQFEEPQKGESTVLIALKQNSQGDQPASTKTNQLMLTFLEDPGTVKEHRSVHAYGRYVGTIEYETSVGTNKEVPAVQVDYFTKKD